MNKVHYGEIYESHYTPCWYIRYGNLITVSKASAEKCRKNHEKKLQKLKEKKEEIKCS